MVLLGQSPNPAASGSATRLSKGKPKPTKSKQVTKQSEPGWVGYGEIPVAQDDVDLPDLHEPPQHALRHKQRRAVEERRMNIGSIEHLPESSTLRWTSRDGSQQTCSNDEFFHQILKHFNTADVLDALDAIAASRASQDGHAAVRAKALRRTSQIGQPQHAASDFSDLSKPSAMRRLQPRLRQPLKRTRHLEDEEDQDYADMDAYTAAEDDYANNDDDADGTDQAFPKMRSLCLANTAAVKQYFVDAGEAMQQLAMKWILKEWIKVIEPKKQSNFPYSPQRANKRQEGPNGDAKAQPAGRPPWWPENTRYKEPDHLKKHERMDLFWALINMCGPEGQDKARASMALQDDGRHHPHPWTALLETSTKDRKKLRTKKEEENWNTSTDARQKFEQRNTILDDVYRLLRHWEDVQNECIDKTTMLSLPNPTARCVRSRASQSSRRSTRHGSVASEATVAEDHEQLAASYPNNDTQAGIHDKVPLDHAFNDNDNQSFSSTSTDANNDHSTMAHHQRSQTPPGHSRLMQTPYGPPDSIMQGNVAPARSTESRNPLRSGSNRVAGDVGSESFGIPRKDTYQVSELRDSLAMDPSRAYAQPMTWSQHQPHLGQASPAMLQVSRCEPARPGHPTFEQVGMHGPLSFHRAQTIEHSYVAPSPWPQTYLPNESFASSLGSFDGMTTTGSSVNVHAYAPPESHFVHPAAYAEPHGMSMNGQSSADARMHDGYYLQ